MEDTDEPQGAQEPPRPPKPADAGQAPPEPSSGLGDLPQELAGEILRTGETPESMRAMSMYVHTAALHSLGLAIHGHEELVETLALTVAKHVITPQSAQRLTLIGPPGSGKTTAALAMASCLRRPVARINMEDITATGWSGTSLGDCLGDLDAQAANLSKRGFGMPSELVEQSVIILDELDKLATGKHEGVSWSHQIQKQQSLLGLLARNGQVVASPDMKGLSVQSRMLSTKKMLIISCGVFDGLPTDRDPVAGEVIKLGLLPELVERIGSLHRLKPLSPEHSIEVFKEGLEPTCAHFAAYGYVLSITREALLFTSQLIGQGHGGPRSGLTWLSAAADRGLTKLLKADAPAGAEYVLTPDDIRVPVRRRTGPEEPPEASSPPTPVW